MPDMPRPADPLNRSRMHTNRIRTRSIDHRHPRIEVCEKRLALSASVAADFLMQALADPASLDEMPPSDISDQSASDPLDLLAQAARVRETNGWDGSGQTVAVIDSGVAWDHIALGDGYGPGYRVVGGWDFAENDSNPYDDGPAGYHGTHVAGLLAGDGANHAGVAPGADLVALRVLDDQGAGELAWIESALQWVHQHQDAFDSPITTVNLSVGAALSEANRSEAMEMLEDELQLLQKSNILVFAASGNLFGDSAEAGVLYPASSPSVVPVTSIDGYGKLSEFAQRDVGILATQGESMSSTVPDHVYGWDGKVDDFASLDGTSMAAPQVAAASMIVRQGMLERGLEPSSVGILETLRQSAASEVDSETGVTYRTLDLIAAVESIPNQVDFGQETDSAVERNHFSGTNGTDRVELDLRDGIKIRINGDEFLVDNPPPDMPLVIDVAGGQDDLRIIGSDQAERLILRSDQQLGSSLSTNAFQMEFKGFEQVWFEGGGGPDRASLYDSASSDTLTSEPGHAVFEGVGFQFEVFDVPRVYVHAVSGGMDTAFLHDGVGNDHLSIRPEFTSLRSDQRFQLAYGFERIYAYANAGGDDMAEIYDSVADDTLSISPGRSLISGANYQVSARGFESTIGHAIFGGDDLVRIYASSESSQWHSTTDMIQWAGDDNAVRIARGFERAEIFEKYQPIQLRTRAHDSPLAFLISEDDEESKMQEMDASRQVFEMLGKS